MPIFKKSLKNNIPLVYALSILDYSWFWLAIWVFFYLKFTDYAGIGLIEAIMTSTIVLGEIPTGAIADLLGKKNTLSLAFLFGALGNLILGLSQSFTQLIIGIIILTIGGVLSSGSTEALVYDSLLSNKEEGKYQKILSNISSAKMITLAIVSAIGGLMYKIYPGLPFIALAVAKLIAFFLSFLLTEPPLDSEVFSLKNYFKQTAQGFSQLFKNKSFRWQNILLITMAAVIMINENVLIDVQLIAQGWTETSLGIIFAIMCLSSAAIGQLTFFLSKKMGLKLANISSAIAIALTMIFIPHLSIILGTILIVLRRGIMEIFINSASDEINREVESRHRSTTLSTYNMIVSAPYILAAYFIGRVMDQYSPHTVTAVIGTGLFLIALVALAGKMPTGKKVTK